MSVSAFNEEDSRIYILSTKFDLQPNLSFLDTGKVYKDLGNLGLLASEDVPDLIENANRLVSSWESDDNRSK